MHLTPRTLNEHTCKVAKTDEEATQPIELGFEHVTGIDEAKLFRKRKQLLFHLLFLYTYCISSTGIEGETLHLCAPSVFRKLALVHIFADGRVGVRCRRLSPLILFAGSMSVVLRGGLLAST